MTSQSVRTTRAADTAFATGTAAIAGWALWCGRGVWFFIDEWVVLTRYHAGNWFEPFNGHLSLVPIAWYRAFLALFGYSFAPWRVVAVASYCAVGVAVYLFARRRVDPWFAVAAALLVLWSSRGQLLVMFPLLLNFTLPLALSVVVIGLLRRDSRRADLAIVGCSAIALATSGVGLLCVVAVGADLALRRERRAARWLVLAVPGALWLAWYFAKGRGHSGAGGTIGSIVKFARKEVVATFVVLGARSGIVGWLVFLAFAAVVVLSIVRWHTFDRAAVVVAFTAAGWIAITAIGRNAAGQKFHVPPVAPDSERYVWVAGVLVVCLVVCCLRGVRIPVVAVVAIGVLAVGNGLVLVRDLREYHRDTPQNAHDVKTFMWAVDALGDRADPNRLLPLGLIPVPTRDYQGLARHDGSPVGHTSVAQLGTESGRLTADGWMVHDLGIEVVPGAEPLGGCTPVAGTASSAGAPVQQPVRVIVTAGTSRPVAVSLRRLARAFDASPVGLIAPGESGELVIPADHKPDPWFVRVDDPTARVVACATP